MIISVIFFIFKASSNSNMFYLDAPFDNSVSYVFLDLTLVFGFRSLINARISNADFKANIDTSKLED